MYYVEINNGQITGKIQVSIEQPEMPEVTEEIYSALTNLPATFIADQDGNIIAVTPAPTPEPEPPEPTTEELLLQAYLKIAELEQRLVVLEGV